MSLFLKCSLLCFCLLYTSDSSEENKKGYTISVNQTEVAVENGVTVNLEAKIDVYKRQQFNTSLIRLADASESEIITKTMESIMRFIRIFMQ